MNEAITTRIYTKAGTTKEEIFKGATALHLGCGEAKLKGAIGVDILALPGVDAVHDLDSYPWPFEDGSADVIVAHSVVEHVTDVVRFFDECWRVLKKGGRLVMEVPHFRSVDAYTDPTHKHFFTAASLNYFLDSGDSLSGYQYTERCFCRIGFWYGWPQPSGNPLARLFKRFIHRHPRFYDQYLSILAPVKVMFWELEAKK